MDLILPDAFDKNELYQFIVNAFKEGTVPLNKEDFLRGFTTNTSDGSLCFENRFGNGNEDYVMLFFYSTFCAVPNCYRKNLRYQGNFATSLLVLDYQMMLAQKTDKLAYLQALRDECEQRFMINAEAYGVEFIETVDSKVRLLINYIDKKIQNFTGENDDDELLPEEND